MPDYVIDTNVLLVASASDPASPFKDENLPAEQMALAYDWLLAFRDDPEAVLVMDGAYGLFEEYEHQLQSGDFGLQVVIAKLPTARLVEVAYDDDGIALLPEALTGSIADRSDRKFVAAALAAGSCPIVNASDSDWYACGEALFGAGIEVVQLLAARPSARRRHWQDVAP